MFTLREITSFINQFPPEQAFDKLKEYYGIAVENLRHLNKRSSLLSFFVIIIAAFYGFNESIKKIEFLGFEIDQKCIIVVAPLLISYFILEWCLIARKRRESMKLMHGIAMVIFEIDSKKEHLFPFFGLFTRIIMPFSFLIELCNIDSSSVFNRKLIRYSIGLLFITISIFICYTLYVSFTKYTLSLPIIICNLLTASCLIQIIVFYLNENKLILETMSDDAAFQLENNNSIINRQTSPQ